MTSSVSFRLCRLKPYLIANTDQLAQRLNVDGGFAQENLQFAAVLIVNTIRCLQKLVDDVLAHDEHLPMRSIAQ